MTKLEITLQHKAGEALPDVKMQFTERGPCLIEDKIGHLLIAIVQTSLEKMVMALGEGARANIHCNFDNQQLLEQFGIEISITL